MFEARGRVRASPAFKPRDGVDAPVIVPPFAGPRYGQCIGLAIEYTYRRRAAPSWLARLPAFVLHQNRPSHAA